MTDWSRADRRMKVAWDRIKGVSQSWTAPTPGLSQQHAPPRKAQLLTETQGFEETYFLALGLGLGLVVVLLLVYVVSTPQIVPRVKLFFIPLISGDEEGDHDEEVNFEEEDWAGYEDSCFKWPQEKRTSNKNARVIHSACMADS